LFVVVAAAVELLSQIQAVCLVVLVVLCWFFQLSFFLKGKLFFLLLFSEQQNQAVVGCCCCCCYCRCHKIDKAVVVELLFLFLQQQVCVQFSSRSQGFCHDKYTPSSNLATRPLSLSLSLSLSPSELSTLDNVQKSLHNCFDLLQFLHTFV
jgi:hypothetical protein